MELHGSHGYLIQEFMSPQNNLRDDRYGGDLEARMWFPIEIVEGIRDALGDDLAVSFRLSAEEFVAGGYGLDEAIRIAATVVVFGMELPPTGAEPTEIGPLVVAVSKLLLWIAMIGWIIAVRKER